MCKSHVQLLEGVLREPADMGTLLDAIVVPHRNLGLDGVEGSLAGHEQVARLVLNLALAWSFATREPDDDALSSAIEHLRDAWWSLVEYETKVLIEDAPAT
jgi:hypothetical protein